MAKLMPSDNHIIFCYPSRVCFATHPAIPPDKLPPAATIRATSLCATMHRSQPGEFVERKSNLTNASRTRMLRNCYESTYIHTYTRRCEEEMATNNFIKVVLSSSHKISMLDVQMRLNARKIRWLSKCMNREPSLKQGC